MFQIWKATSAAYRRTQSFHSYFCSDNTFIFFRFLVENGANVVAVNSEGEIAVDLAEEDDMREYLEEEIRKQGCWKMPSLKTFD